MISTSLREDLVRSAQPIDLRSADLGQVKLAYVEAGSGEPVVFVHGVPTDYRAWNSQIGPFSGKYHVIAYSQRLAEPNQNSMDYEKSTIENNSADLVRLIEELGISPVNLVGHSYGGFASAFCASANPQLIRTLTLIEPAVSTILLKNLKSKSEFLGLLFAHPSIAISAAKFQRNSLDPSLKAFRQGDFDAALRYNLDGIMNRHGAFEQLPESVSIMVKENQRTVGELMAEVAATRGVLGSIVGMLESGVTHIGVATDHIIESFRNDLWPGYKTSEGVDPRLLSQFPLLEAALEGMGVVVWPMVELEADDALAGAALSLGRISAVSRVYICTPDKDLAQCVRDDRVVQLDRRARQVRNETGVREKFGVSPLSIPDYLGLVGDSADGYPGLTGWGDKSAGTVIGFYGHLEAVPSSALDWKVTVRRADHLAQTLQQDFKLALLFRDLATLRTKEPKIRSANELRWRGPNPSFAAMSKRLDVLQLVNRVADIAAKRQAERRSPHPR